MEPVTYTSSSSPTPEQIKAFGDALSGFAGVELALIILAIVAIILIFVLGPKYLDRRYKFKMAELNKDNQALENETNALVKEVSARLSRIEENGIETNNRLAVVEREKIDTKMLARDILRLNLRMETNDMATRMEAARDYLKLGGNGDSLQIVKSMVLKNPELWNYILEKDAKNYTSAEMRAYYHSALEEIDVKIRDIKLKREETKT
jgi:hypothetical protein